MDTVTATGKKRNPESPSERSEKMKKHHHHRKKSGYRKKKKFFAGCAAIVLVILGISAAIVWRAWKDQRSYQITASNSFDVGSGYRTVIRDGKKYEYNQTITTLLFAVLDSTDPMENGDGVYGNKAEAASILLVALDKLNEKVSVIALSGDTVTEIHRYTETGTDMGTYESPLSRAYSYGDGGRASCRNLQAAVSGLLSEIPVQEYVIINQSALEEINIAVDDLTAEFLDCGSEQEWPELAGGTIITLNDTNIRTFVQCWNTNQDFKTYVTSYVDQWKQTLGEDIAGTWEKISQAGANLQSSVTATKSLNMANFLEKISFEDISFYVLEGENRVTDEANEFYPNETALGDLVLDLFYEAA